MVVVLGDFRGACEIPDDTMPEYEEDPWAHMHHDQYDDDHEELNVFADLDNPAPLEQPRQGLHWPSDAGPTPTTVY